MENKINLVELLKDCPQGMELDCTMWKNVVFDHIDMAANYPIFITKMNGEKEYLTEDGCFNFDLGAKCVIFPKGKNTWEGFVPPCKFKDGDVVAFDTEKGVQLFIFKEYLFNCDSVQCYMMLDCDGKIYFDGDYYVKRLATEEEKQKLFQAIKDKGYVWNAETKTLKKLIEPKFKIGDKVKSKTSQYEYTIVDILEDAYIMSRATDKIDYPVPFCNEDNFELVPNKFDINTLVPFESRVLVRDYNREPWRAAFWGCLINSEVGFNYDTTRGSYKQCIPCKGNEHLLGTTDDCDEYFKTWE